MDFTLISLEKTVFPKDFIDLGVFLCKNPSNPKENEGFSKDSFVK